MSFGISTQLDTVSSKVEEVYQDLEKARHAITQLNEMISNVTKDVEKAQEDVIALNNAVTVVTYQLSNTTQTMDSVFSNVEQNN